MESRNLVYIIGNGFDIAHDLPTKYSDFADNLLTEISKRIITNDNSIFTDRFKENNEFFHSENQITTRIMESRFNEIFRIIKYNQNIDEDLDLYIRKNQNLLKLIVKNEFLIKLYSNNYKNWFDIENSFFEELKIIKDELIKIEKDAKERPFRRENGSTLKNTESEIKKVIKLNNELEDIKNELEKYLKSINPSLNQTILNFFFKDTENVNNLLVLDFNYTNTFKIYFEFIEQKVIDYLIPIKIHGSLTNKDIIFGYGNDKNEHYNEIKNLEIDEFLEHFKTFKYLDSNNYNLTIDFLDSLDSYEVKVIGHSLQQTDKTLLSRVFNSPKCDKIHLLKRSDLEETEKHKAYRTLSFALSRIISNEDSLRDTVVNYGETKDF